MAGRLVSVLTNQVYSAGNHSVVWKGKDVAGREVATGTYLVQMKTPSRVERI